MVLRQRELSELSVARGSARGQVLFTCTHPRSAAPLCQNGTGTWPLERDDTLLDSFCSMCLRVLVLHVIQLQLNSFGLSVH